MLNYRTINDRDIVGIPEFINQIIKVDKELRRLDIGITVGKREYKGLLIGAIKTSSWRSEKVQKKLFNDGTSPIMDSNHRRGTAIDVFPKIAYIKRIEPILRQYGLINDIPNDSVHFNYKSNDYAKSFNIIDSAEPKEYKDMILKKESNKPHIYLIKNNKKFMIVDYPTLKEIFDDTEIIEEKDLDYYEDGGSIMWIERIVN